MFLLAPNPVSKKVTRPKKENVFFAPTSPRPQKPQPASYQPCSGKMLMLWPTGPASPPAFCTPPTQGYRR